MDISRVEWVYYLLRATRRTCAFFSPCMMSPSVAVLYGAALPWRLASGIFDVVYVSGTACERRKATKIAGNRSVSETGRAGHFAQTKILVCSYVTLGTSPTYVSNAQSEPPSAGCVGRRGTFDFRTLSFHNRGTLVTSPGGSIRPHSLSIPPHSRNMLNNSNNANIQSRYVPFQADSFRSRETVLDRSARTLEQVSAGTTMGDYGRLWATMGDPDGPDWFDVPGCPHHND